MKKAILTNTFWMILEKIIGTFGLIFVTSYVAKYIGPSAFGVISLVAAIFTIIQSIAMFGSESILFKRISQNRLSGVKLMKSMWLLRALVYCSFSLICLVYIFLTHEFLTIAFALATFFATYFLTQDVILIYNDATLKSKLNTFANIFGLVVSLILRFLIVHFEFDVVCLSIPIVTTTLIPYLLRIYFFKNEYINRSIVVSKKKVYLKYMIFAGLPLAISSVSISLYTRFSQILLVKYFSSFELGIYSAAAALATSWGFITASFITSNFSYIYKITDQKESLRTVAKLNGMVFVFCCIMVFFIYLFGKYALNFLYGSDYMGSYPVMIILSCATGFSAMGTIAYRFIVKESGYKYLSIKIFFTLIVNVVACIFLIPVYGIFGAAYSTLITEFLSLTILNYFFKNRVIAHIHLLSLNYETYLIKNNGG